MRSMAPSSSRFSRPSSSGTSPASRRSRRRRITAAQPAGRRLTEHRRPASRGCDEAEQAADRRRLARAVRSEEPEHAALRHDEVEPVRRRRSACLATAGTPCAILRSRSLLLMHQTDERRAVAGDTNGKERCRCHPRQHRRASVQARAPITEVGRQEPEEGDMDGWRIKHIGRGTAVAAAVVLPGRRSGRRRRVRRQRGQARLDGARKTATARRSGTPGSPRTPPARCTSTCTSKGCQQGLHGIHVHSVGSCRQRRPSPTPAATTTPAQRRHGHHAGDLPNLVVNGAGRRSPATPRSRASRSTTMPPSSTATAAP